MRKQRMRNFMEHLIEQFYFQFFQTHFLDGDGVPIGERTHSRFIGKRGQSINIHTALSRGFRTTLQNQN